MLQEGEKRFWTKQEFFSRVSASFLELSEEIELTRDNFTKKFQPFLGEMTAWNTWSVFSQSLREKNDSGGKCNPSGEHEKQSHLGHAEELIYVGIY